MSVTPPPSKQSQIKQCHHRRGLLFSLALPFFSLPQIEASSATKYNANTFFIMDFFLLISICNRRKKPKNKKTQNQKTTHTHKKIGKTKKNPGECVQRGRGGGRKDIHWVGQINVNCPPPSKLLGEKEIHSPSLLFSLKYNTHSDPRALRQSQLIDRHIELLFLLQFVTPPPLAHVTLTITNRSHTNPYLSIFLIALFSFFFSFPELNNMTKKKKS